METTAKVITQKASQSAHNVVC